MSNQRDAKTYTDDWDEPQPAREAPERAEAAPPEESASQEPDHAAAPAAEPLRPPEPAVEGAGPRELQTPPVKIPMSSEIERVPGLFARSAIFGVWRGENPALATPFLRREAGAQLEDEQLACYGEEYGVVFTGPRLDMRDKRVWEVALRTAKERGWAGQEFPLSATDIAKALGAKGKPSGDRLKAIAASLTRLAEARIDYRVQGSACGSANLLGSARETTSGWRVSIDAGLVTALERDKQFVMHPQTQREQLCSELAKWMHDFVSTHSPGFEKGFELPVLAELCGWSAKSSSKFSSRLREALDSLRAVCPELVSGYEFTAPKRSSEFWRVRVDRGTWKESFRCPAAEQERAAEKARQARERKEANERRKAKPKGGAAL